jgi:hypothetical protein
MIIHWDLIAKAIGYYQSLNYRYIEVPWNVSDEAVNATLPIGIESLRTVDGALVGSAEQSFIQLLLDQHTLDGKYVACTPCFRNEIIDRLHQRTFMKVELFSALNHSTLNQVTDDALSFYKMLPGGELSTIVETEQGYDIYLNDIEIGSYGIRKYKNYSWIYGTGFAEPRYGIAAGI